MVTVAPSALAGGANQVDGLAGHLGSELAFDLKVADSMRGHAWEGIATIDIEGRGLPLACLEDNQGPTQVVARRRQDRDRALRLHHDNTLLLAGYTWHLPSSSLLGWTKEGLDPGRRRSGW
ncbi:hypothetical protein [Thermogemmatispora carboxidivorans]|uniref:hypothetical protein n=1 Tax=Thermogemmatispora carboxidivorans TaxID=1382306 RepID=UPI00138E1A11|nr:hypothetical protein [Thermogemmatispora carboxidivorans]